MLDRFLAELADEGRSPWTVEKYRYAAARFLSWAGRRGLRQVTTEGVRQYLRRFPAPATRRWHLAVVRRLLAHAVARGELAQNPAVAVPYPRVPERAPRVISPEEEDALFRAASGQADALVLVHLLRYSGLREGEVVGYRQTVYDPYRRRRVRRDHPGIRVRDVDLGQRIVRVQGKFGQIGVAYLSVQTVDLLRWWTEDRANSAAGGNADALLFATPDGRPRGVAWAEATFRRLIRTAALGRRVTPHMLRHTMLTRYLEGGGDLRAAQRLARHRRITSTLTYADYVRDGALQEEFDRHMRNKPRGG